MFSPIEAMMTAEARGREFSNGIEHRARLLSSNEAGAYAAHATAPVRLAHHGGLFSWLAAGARELSARLATPTPRQA